MERVALITGAGSGIGRAAAVAFAKAGMRVVAADVSELAGEETVDLVRAAGGTAIFVRTDVAVAADVEQMVAVTTRTFGRLDCAFNNAGIATVARGPVDEFPEEEWQRMIAVNLTGVWLCLKHECRQMLANGGGSIVNTASIMGKVSRPGLGAYSASKAGVIGLTQSVALDYANRNIRVNAICPGGIATPMTEAPAMRERLIGVTPMSRMGEPREIADTVVWLCSPQSSFTTGQALGVDGGYLASGA